MWVQLSPAGGATGLVSAELRDFRLHVESRGVEHSYDAADVGLEGTAYTYQPAGGGCSEDPVSDDGITLRADNAGVFHVTLTPGVVTELWAKKWDDSPPCRYEASPGDRVWVTADVRAPGALVRVGWDGWRQRSCDGAGDKFDGGTFTCSDPATSGFVTITSCIP